MFFFSDDQMRKYPPQFWKILAVAFGFTFGLLVLETAFFPNYYYDFLINLKNSNYSSILRLLISGGANFLAAFCFIAASLLSSYKYRIIYFSLFCLAVLTEYGYQRAFSRFTTLEDIGNALFAADMRIMFSSIGEYFVFSAIFPCLLYGLLLLGVKPVLKNGLKWLLAVFVLYSGFFTFTAYFTTNSYPSISFNAYFRTLFNFPVSWYFGSIHQPAFSVFYQTPRMEVSYRALNLPNNNIVFIVDESMRGDHLSVNGYERQTSPFLEELNRKGVIKNWGIAVSGTTCSITSNNLLLSGVNEIPDTSGNTFKFPTIFQYAKAMGYKTFYFDGQLSYRWVGKPSDVQYVDEWLFSNVLRKGEWYDIDGDIARKVNEIVSSSTGNFIWVNKFGVHFPYKNSYPDSAAKWLPIPQAGEKFSLSQASDEQEKIKNSYDNAILYNSEIFFTRLFENGLAVKTFYVYTSDHGQNLSENGRASSHCLTTKNEAKVPLLLIAEPNVLPEADAGFKASHANIFPALLDLMNFPESERRIDYSPSLLKAKANESKTRFYYSGNLHSKISSKKLAFDE